MKKKWLSLALTLVMCLGLSIPVSATTSNNVKIDTGKTLTVQEGKTYQFKLTSNSKPTFVSGNSKVFSVTYKGHTGNDYFYQIKAVGAVGQVTGFYLNGSKTPVTVATVVFVSNLSSISSKAKFFPNKRISDTNKDGNVIAQEGPDGKLHDVDGKLYNQDQIKVQIQGGAYSGCGAYVVNGVVYNEDGSVVNGDLYIDGDRCIHEVDGYGDGVIGGDLPGPDFEGVY